MARPRITKDENRILDNRVVKWWIANYKKAAYSLVIFLMSIRGVVGYWNDLKLYIIDSEIVAVSKEKREEPYNEKVYTKKNETIKERLYREKGIIITDKDIKKYGVSK